jgi:hypothetical protein
MMIRSLNLELTLVEVTVTVTQTGCHCQCCLALAGSPAKLCSIFKLSSPTITQMLRCGHARAEGWRPATNCSRAVGIAEINFKKKNLPVKPVDNVGQQLSVSKSET